MNTPINHDEHQFIAGAKLLSSKLMLPYSSFPFYQLPNILLVYSIIFSFTSYLLLGARTFSVICAFIVLLMMYLTALKVFKDKNRILKYIIASFSVFLMVSNPVFIYSFGKAWNHDLPLLLTILSMACLFKLIEKQSARYSFLSGFLACFAICTRISFAPVIFPFLFCVLAFPKTGNIRKTLRLLTYFIFGAFISAIPTLVLFINAPEQFVFYVYKFHLGVDVQYLQSIGWHTPFRYRIEYFIREIAEPRNLTVTFTGLVFILWAGLYCLRRRINITRLKIIILIIPFLVMGSIIKPIVFYQYFYAPLPFIILGAVYGISYLKDKLQHYSILLFIFIAGISIYSGGSEFWRVNKLHNPQLWTTVEFHNYGCEISKYTGKGKVLTLSPLFVLEGGAGIYSEFCSSPFTWRTSELVNPAMRKKMKIISKTDLDEFLRNDPPVAILTGFESGLEGMFIKWGKDNGYVNVPLSQQKLMIRKK